MAKNYRKPYRKAERVILDTANKQGNLNRRKKPLLIIAASVVALAVIIAVYFFVFSNNSKVAAAVSPSVNVTIAPELTTAPTPVSTPSAAPAIATTPSPVIDPNNWRLKFADKFSSDGQVYQDDHSYKSANININITKNTDNGVVYFITDIYVAELKYFKTAFGRNTNVLGGTQYVYKALRENNGIVAINGDYCIVNPGLIIRNGEEYKRWKTSVHEVLVMYNDGSMKAFHAGYNWDEIRAQHPYQTWGFGPELLSDDGQPITSSDPTYNEADDPRTAIGYFEPGHYCFIVVDGRQKGYAYPGYSLKQLSQLMYKLGCKVSFNLDGGGSTQLAFMGKQINKPCPKTYRKDSDIIYITDEG